MQCLPSQHLACNFNKTRDSTQHKREPFFSSFFFVFSFSFLPVAHGHGKDFFAPDDDVSSSFFYCCDDNNNKKKTTTTILLFSANCCLLTAKHCDNYLIKELKEKMPPASSGSSRMNDARDFVSI